MIAVPHDQWGERPLLLVVPVPGQSPSKDSLLEFLKVRLPLRWRAGRKPTHAASCGGCWACCSSAPIGSLMCFNDEHSELHVAAGPGWSAAPSQRSAHAPVGLPNQDCAASSFGMAGGKAHCPSC